MNRVIFLLSLTFLIGGCAGQAPQAAFSQLGALGVPKPDSYQVEVYFTKKPERAYREIGILSTLTWQYQPNDMVYVAVLKQKAKEIGADAIIMLEGQAEIATNYVTKQSYQGKTYKAMAIAYD